VTNLRQRTDRAPGLCHIGRPTTQENTMNHLKLPLAALILALFAQPALAQSGTSQGIDKRQADQQQRIDQGVANGDITEREAASLQAGQRKVQQMEDSYGADGRMTGGERSAIAKEQAQQARNIRRAETNRQVRRDPATIDERQATQRARIDQGVSSGWLSEQAAVDLRRGQDGVRRMEARAKADGTISAAEADRIRIEQDKQHQAISLATRR
jgi:hypothetical protein